ncbi:lysylphosphatidylglycerol synthase domain-containing protein [Sphaerisporangium fuscum]|uniref:lysylphosphatidylglycerol synthase domain-containing protein n=1 Tax=Sphaerisporangium fuscum TaxID=2835868 RepID=UPI001BDD0CD1|nr:lysylphosphatidylglycerol synthase domain-containing protein [Sphaerisporangium fuscum]
MSGPDAGTPDVRTAAAAPPIGEPRAEATGAAGRGGGRRRLSAVLRTAACLAVLALLGYQVWRVRHGLGDSLRLVGWSNVLLATALTVAGGVPGFFGWRMLLAGLGTRLPLPVAVRVFFVAGLTRYLPGGVWPAVAHAAQARPLGEPPARLAGAFVASQGLGVVAGFAVGLVALPRLAASSPVWWALLPVLAAALVPLAAPRSLGRLLGLAQRILRRGHRPPDLPGRRTLLAVTGLMAIGWLVSGAHVTVLAVALGAPPLAAATVGVGGFALSTVAGIFTLVMPSGLGAREAVLGLTVATLLSGPGLVTLVALSRVLITVADLASTVVVLAVLAWTARRRPAASPPAPEAGVSTIGGLR